MSEKEQESLTAREQHAVCLKEKERLLAQYKALEPELEYAMDDLERGHLESQRNRLATKIKALAAQMRTLESSEDFA